MTTARIRAELPSWLITAGLLSIFVLLCLCWGAR